MKNFKTLIGLFVVSLISFGFGLNVRAASNIAEIIDKDGQVKEQTTVGNLSSYFADSVLADGDTVRLLEDITDTDFNTLVIDNTKTFTFDLNGHSIKMTSGDASTYVITVKGGANVTLTDSSSKAGSIENTVGRGIKVENGKLTVDKVTIKSVDRTIQINPTSTSEKAEVIVNGGTIESTKSSGNRTIFLWGNNANLGALLTVNGGNIIAPISSQNSAAINLGSSNAGGNKVVINGGNISGFNGVRLYGNGQTGMTIVEMNAGSINAVNAGIIMSSNADAKETEVYLYGGSITAQDMEGQFTISGDAVAVKQDQTGKLVIGKEDGTGPTILGETGIAIKEGDITIQGGSIKANGEYRHTPTMNDDGTEDTGAAVSVTTTGSDSNIKLKITGGDITSENGNAVYEGIATGRDDVTESAVESLEITGGNFESAKDVPSVIAEKYESDFITGGTFSEDVSDYFDNTKVGQSESGTVGVIHNIGISSSENGNVVAAKTAATGEEVTLNVNPAEGYVLDTIKVVDKNGNEITVTDGKFIMPDSDVTVTATFKTVSGTVDNPNTNDNVYYYVGMGFGSIALLGLALYFYKKTCKAR